MALEYLKHDAPELLKEMQGKKVRDPETGKMEPMLLVWLHMKER